MPQMIEYSAVTAIHTLWLAARAEDIGLGRVSILDPERVKADLDVPSDWTLIGCLCLGYMEEENNRPELEREQWEQRRSFLSVILKRRSEKKRVAITPAFATISDVTLSGI